MISSLLTLGDVLSLAAIAGNQIAWWQLGFQERRAVVRRARQGIPHPDPDVWHDARQWARQMLDAPWWWRLARATVISGFGVLGLASTLGVAVELQAEYAISAGVLIAVPLAIAWAWRQTSQARVIDRVDPAERAENSRWVPVVLLVVSALAMTGSVILIAQTVRANHEKVYGCALLPENAQIRTWWVAHGGKSGSGGCPTGETGRTASGAPYVRTTNGVISTTPLLGPFVLPRETFEAWQANWSALGEPTGAGLGDGAVNFVNFQGGHIMQPTGGRAIVEFGTSYHPPQTIGGPCVLHDRPCVVRADRSGTTIRAAWHWGIADAFNVSWRALGDDDITSVEVAGNEYTITGLTPGTVYILHVQACDKQFLSSSKCTPSSAYVVEP
jgi:hypothetical protein